MKHELTKIAFFIAFGISACLIVGGFFVPPMGQIDGSVLQGVGELMGFGALALGYQALKDGATIKATKGNLNVEVGK